MVHCDDLCVVITSHYFIDASCEHNYKCYVKTFFCVFLQYNVLCGKMLTLRKVVQVWVCTCHALLSYVMLNGNVGNCFF
jgi:hypothetical protein